MPKQGKRIAALREAVDVKKTYSVEEAVKIVKDGQQWYCLLTNDLKLPISRRKKSTVAGWFGHSTKIVPVKSAKQRAG